jgi:hypothetical protein
VKFIPFVFFVDKLSEINSMWAGSLGGFSATSQIPAKFVPTVLLLFYLLSSSPAKVVQ